MRFIAFPFPLWKMCTENIELTDYDGTSVTIEKGTRVLVPTYSIHHHPEQYTEPSLFNPERFDESNGKRLKYCKEAGLFMPFGNGPRMCLGQQITVFTTNYKYNAHKIVHIFKYCFRHAFCHTANQGRHLRIDQKL